MLTAGIYSEYSVIKTVLLHEPGPEVENMTPATAERALYSDILNLPIARVEYSQFKGVLEKVTRVLEVKPLLKSIIGKADIRNELISALEVYSGNSGISSDLSRLSDNDFTTALIEGIKLPQTSLTNFLQPNKYLINPLHNMFFMRDASFCIGKTVFISSMARTVRKPEAILLNSIYNNLLDTDSRCVSLNGINDKRITIEGGDVLVVTPEILIVGIGSRTTPESIDYLINKVSEYQPLKYVLVQELPLEPESFIHLDMVFTLLSQNECMIYKPILGGEWHYHSVLMNVENGKVKNINYVDNIMDGLKKCGLDFDPIYCGGGDPLSQEREQWHSGANFFAVAPSKIIGYARNSHTTEALAKKGYEPIPAHRVIDDSVKIVDYKKCLITIEGSELARGGGGPRCMTMPLLRE